MKKVIIIHGPNLNLLGSREPDIYGTESLDEINAKLVQEALQMGVELETFQSNHEGAIVDRIQDVSGDVDAIIINPGAFTHYSYAIRDALVSVGALVIEVHLSNIYRREDFRQHSVIAPVAQGQISGMGPLGYKLALFGALETLSRQEEG